MVSDIVLLVLSLRVFCVVCASSCASVPGTSIYREQCKTANAEQWVEQCKASMYHFVS